MTTFTAQVDALFSEWDKPDSPGCAVVIIREGEVLYSRGYGMADLEHGVPITPRSVFDIASNSKQFTALCVALLAWQGKLSLGDDIRRYLPEMRPYEPPITLRHLLHHTGGLRDYCTLMVLAGLPFENDYPEEEIIGLITRQKELNFPPGEEHLYSNSGYFLLAQVVERVAGMSLRAFAEENIFGPLGMKNTHFHDNLSEIVQNRAVGYAPKEGGGFRLDMSLFDVVGDGGLYTTVEDLCLWDANFTHNIIGGCGQELIDAMTTPGRLNSGETLDYGLGLALGSYRGLRTIAHGGSWMGYRSQMIRFPEQRFSVICLANLSSFNPTRLVKRIADIYLARVFTEPGEEPAPGGPALAEPLPAAPADKAGFYYEAKSGDIWELMVRDGKLWAEAFGLTFWLVPAGPGCYRSVDRPAVTVEFEPRSPGRPVRMRVQTDGDKPDLLEKLTPVPLKEDRLVDYAGDYFSEELGVFYRLVVEDGGLVLSRKHTPREPLKPVSPGLFKGASITFEFVRDPQNEVTGFDLRAGWVRRIHFVKQ